MSNSSTKTPETTRILSVEALARVEGEGALHLTMRGDEVESVRLQIFEPPRFFEGFLRGRDYSEVPDITARICGICPVAYQMSSAQALEKAMGVHDRIDARIRGLRDLLYCGEWIESHVLHMFLLHLPDFLGFESAIAMAADHGATVQRALRIKKLGNTIMEVLGGRAVHPVGVCVGGFYRAPRRDELLPLLAEVEACLDEMCELTLMLAERLEFPDLERDYELVCLQPTDGYPMNGGRIVSNLGLDVAAEDFLDAVIEHQVSHSTALHSRIRGRGSYLVGPLARLDLCHERLHPRAAELLPRVCEAASAELPWRNNFLSLLARGVETVHALGLAADLIRDYAPPDPPRVELASRAGEGAHATEAPRGICWHRYRTLEDGTIAEARIIPPTSQNQSSIEEDLALMGERLAKLPDEAARLACEHLIRNYDPCISCSTHFLRFSRSWLDADGRGRRRRSPRDR